MGVMKGLIFWPNKRCILCGSPVYDVELSFGTFKQILNAKLKMKLEESWKENINSAISYQLIPTRVYLKRINVFSNKVSDVKYLHWFLTGSCPLRKYLFSIGKSFTDKCLFCPGEIETRPHCSAVLSLQSFERQTDTQTPNERMASTTG